VKHKPSRFLGHAKSAAEFVTTDSVPRIGDAPGRDEPLIEPKRGILENGPDLVRELLPAVLAAQNVPRLDFPDPLRSAVRASSSAVWPLDPPHVKIADFQIGEVADGFKKGFGFHSCLSFSIVRERPGGLFRKLGRSVRVFSLSTACLPFFCPAIPMSVACAFLDLSPTGRKTGSKLAFLSGCRSISSSIFDRTGSERSRVLATRGSAALGQSRSMNRMSSLPDRDCVVSQPSFSPAVSGAAYGIFGNWLVLWKVSHIAESLRFLSISDPDFSVATYKKSSLAILNAVHAAYRRNGPSDGIGDRAHFFVLMRFRPPPRLNRTSNLPSLYRSVPVFQVPNRESEKISQNS
jgi:hypothetical protein